MIRPASAGRAGDDSVKSIRPTTTEPIAGNDPPQRLSTILARFVALLAVAIALLVLAWSR
jgi:hypothetical protein